MAAPTKPIQTPYVPTPIGGSEHSSGPTGTGDDSDKYVDTSRASAHKDRVKAPTKDFTRTEKWLYHPTPQSAYPDREMDTAVDNKQLQKGTGSPGTSDLMP